MPASDTKFCLLCPHDQLIILQHVLKLSALSTHACFDLLSHTCCWSMDASLTRC